MTRELSQFGSDESLAKHIHIRHMNPKKSSYLSCKAHFGALAALLCQHVHVLIVNADKVNGLKSVRRGGRHDGRAGVEEFFARRSARGADARAIVF